MVATDWERMISRSFQWDVSADGIVNSKYDTRLQDEKFITNLHIIFEHSAPSNTQLRTPLRTSKVWVQNPQSPQKKNQSVPQSLPPHVKIQRLEPLGARSIYSFWAPLSFGISYWARGIRCRHIPMSWSPLWPHASKMRHRRRKRNIETNLPKVPRVHRCTAHHNYPHHKALPAGVPPR